MASKNKSEPEQAKVIQNKDPVVVTLDLPVEPEPTIAGVIATTLDDITPQESAVAVGNVLEPEDIKIRCSLWARTDGKMRKEHVAGFEAWANGQGITAATAKEWRKHFETYRNARVR